MFTDGVVDQFHHKTGKKVTNRRLIELLKETAYLPFSEQELRLNTFITEWRGQAEQVDDILLIGLQIDL